MPILLRSLSSSCRRRSLGAVATSIAILLFGSCRTNGPKGVDAGVSASALPAVFANANFCQVDADCYDMGPYCPLECHVLVNDSTPLTADVFAYILDARGLEIEGKCQLSCPSSFAGVVCRDRKCQLREKPPVTSTCWRPDGGAIECLELLTQFNKANECQSMCDGKAAWDKRRFLIRVPIDDVNHRTEVFTADYIRCEDCK